MLTDIAVLREIAVYNVFFVAGYIFYKNISRKRLLTLTGFSFIVLFVLIAYEKYSQGAITSMQAHKFPPDLTFLCYSVFALCLVSIGCNGMTNLKLPRQVAYIVGLWNRRGFTIYLYQNYAYFAFVHIVPEGMYHTDWFIINITVAALLIFVLSTAMSFVTYPFEKCCFNLTMNKK